MIKDYYPINYFCSAFVNKARRERSFGCKCLQGLYLNRNLWEAFGTA